MLRLSNKIALITGASSGIGAASAELFIKEGAKVFIADIKEKEGSELAKKLGENAKFIKLDVKEENEWINCIQMIDNQYSRLDIIFNNAGIMTSGNPEDTTLDEWENEHQVNLRSVFLGCKYGIKIMKRYGGSIINMSSRSGIVGVKNAAAYSSTKAAIKNYTKSVALYCAEKGYKIRCNSVIPAAIETDIWDKIFGKDEFQRKQKIQETIRGIPLGFMGKAIDVAYAALFLASEESRFITGSEITIDGGILAGSAASPNKD